MGFLLMTYSLKPKWLPKFSRTPHLGSKGIPPGERKRRRRVRMENVKPLSFGVEGVSVYVFEMPR